MDDCIFKVENLSFSYGGGFMLNNISFTIGRGDFVGIVGPNGSGKSTLIKACLGLIRPHKGNITMFGKDSSKFKQWGLIAYIPQKATAFNQAFPATVEEVVAANLYQKIGMGRRLSKEHKEQIDRVLDIVGMKDYRKRLIGRLSGGQQQRVFIAKALVSDPEIIFMDEPTVGIDYKSEESFYELMEFLNKVKRITLVMVTHDTGAISSRVNKIACIADGKLYIHDGEGCCDNDICFEAYGGSKIIPLRHNH
ncbi:MAG: metal ABC transporter ATP-binding protein [Bacillota bacterium]